MKKFSNLPNSNDLTTAVKRTSLKGRTFQERLLLGLNFQMINLSPLSIELAPMAGYRFNSRLSVGVGGMYRQTFADTMTSLSPNVIGYKGFISYEIVSAFFAYGEYARNSPGVQQVEGVSQRLWKETSLIGIGRKFSISKYLDMSVLALYDFFYKKEDSIYAHPFIIRVGFQLSDVALLKKKAPVDYFGK